MKLISFGVRHGKPDPPDGTVYIEIDVRPRFGRNPYHDRKLRKLRGTDREVADDILKTPNFQSNYEALKRDVVAASQMGIEQVWIGCTGGHHRSVYLANRLGCELGLEVEHRDFGYCPSPAQHWGRTVPDFDKK